MFARFLTPLFLFSGLLVLATGCATHHESLAPVEQALHQGDYARADTLMHHQDDLAEGKDRLLYYLHGGVTAHLNGNYRESNRLFDEADRRFEELYTKSVSAEIGAFLINDMTRAYPGEDFEKVMVHYYMALNYLMLGELDEALVECRRVNIKLKEFNQKYDENKNVYKADAFIHYMMGFIYEAAGDANNAFIAYRNAVDVYETDYLTYYGLGVPAQLKEDLLRAAYEMGFRDELQRYQRKWQLMNWQPPDRLAARGEVVFIWDNGSAPFKDQNALEIPFEDYYLRVAFPTFVARPPQLSQAVVDVTGTTTRTEVVQDVAAIAIKNLEDRAGRVVARAAVRGVAKYAMKKTVEKEFGEVAGCIFNIFASATEQADTRSWFTLPDNIQIARLYHHPGQYDVRLEFRDRANRVLLSDTIPNVALEAGHTAFITYRTFR